jgi:predicted PurR-regulated permease PerM
MTVRQQAIAWAAAATAFGLALYALSAMLLPFIAALAIAYLLDPLADKLERLGLGRTWATVLIIVFCALIMLLLAAIAIPPLLRQLAAFIEAFPQLAAKAQAALVGKGDAWLASWGIGLAEKFGFDPTAAAADLQNVMAQVLSQAAKWLLGLLQSLISGGAALINMISLLVVTPVVAFYLLLDWDRMVASIDRNIPPRDRMKIRQIGHEIDRALAGFLRGQSLVAMFLGLWYAGGLSLIGLNYGFLIGVIGGFTSFIPYVGSLLVLILAMIVAVAQGWPDFTLPLMAVGVVASGQFLEGNILSPRLVGDSVGLHPVWLMFALLAFGALFGFTGLLIAVPVSAALGVVTRHALEAYRASSFFLAGAPPDETQG